MAVVRLRERYELRVAALTAANIAVAVTTIAIAVFRRFGLASAPVVVGGPAGSTVVRAVSRFMLASVACGRMLVSISVDADAQSSCAVPASLPNDDESLVRVAPSTRQNFSASSFSTRLQLGQRFILQCCDLSQLSYSRFWDRRQPSMANGKRP